MIFTSIEDILCVKSCSVRLLSTSLQRNLLKTLFYMMHDAQLVFVLGPVALIFSVVKECHFRCSGFLCLRVVCICISCQTVVSQSVYAVCVAVGCVVMWDRPMVDRSRLANDVCANRSHSAVCFMLVYVLMYLKSLCAMR